jgi:threonine dehydrogenase-like Zn-dependent dehydrogenase
MKALVLEAYNKLIYKDVPDPVIGSDEVLVQVKACGICGSDVHGLDGSTGRRIPPLIMGHEASGVIVKTGNDVKIWKAGDRVTFDSTVFRLDDWFTRRGLYNISDNREVLGVSAGTYRRNGAFAEFIAIPQHILYIIPENVSFEQAAMVEAVAVALHAINISGFSPGNSCVVVGAGMIGIFIIKLLKVSGASSIIAIDVDENHLQKAEKAGADFTFLATDENLVEKIKSVTGGRGADNTFEAVGKNDSVNMAIDVVRKGGSVTLVGKIQGSCAICGEYEAVLDFLRMGKISVDDQISAIAPLSEGDQWFERLYRKEENLGKVILRP